MGSRRLRGVEEGGGAARAVSVDGGAAERRGRRLIGSLYSGTTHDDGMTTARRRSTGRRQ